MSQEQVLGMVRHILTTIGGIVVARGYADESTVTAIVGGAVALVGFIWSFQNKKVG